MVDPLFSSVESLNCVAPDILNYIPIQLHRDKLPHLITLGISKPVATILLEIQQRSDDYNAPSGNESSATSNALSSCTSSALLLQRLLYMNPYHEDGLVIACITESCRLGLILYVLFSDKTTYPDPTLLMNSNLHKLKNSLEIMLRLVDTKNSLLLWLLFVGGVSSRTLPEHKWFTGQLSVVVTDLNLMSWDDIKLCLNRFPWTDEFCESSYRRLWEDVVGLMGSLSLIQEQYPSNGEGTVLTTG